MIYKIFILFLSCCLNFIQASPFSVTKVEPLYQDEELQALWNSLDNIYSPTRNDYEKVQHYLEFGQRPYLTPIFDYLLQLGWYQIGTSRSIIAHSRLLQKLKLVGVNGEMPEFHQIQVNGAAPNDKSRCILLYASHNSAPNTQILLKKTYEEKAWDLVKELESIGYKGHVLLRIGGYPLTDIGGLRLAHVPYSFKVLSFIEASLLGYDNVLWLDSSIHPTNDLEAVFTTLQSQGTYLMWNGINLDYDYNYPLIPSSTVTSCSLNVPDLAHIPHIIAGICGVSFNKPQAHDLIREWYRLSSLAYPAASLYPEEFLLSIACYRAGCIPTGHIGHYLDVHSVTPKKTIGGAKPFWFDKG